MDRELKYVALTESVVDLAVFCLICSDIQQQVPHRLMTFRHIPVADGNIWCLQVVPFWQMSVVHIFNGKGVCICGLLFQVSDESVARRRRHEVGEEKCVGEDTLCTNDHKFHKAAWLGHLHKSQKMHPFVVCIFQHGLDPPIIALQAPQASEVSQHTGCHAWHGGDGLEKDEADEPLPWCHLVGFAFVVAVARE